MFFFLGTWFVPYCFFYRLSNMFLGGSRLKGTKEDGLDVFWLIVGPAHAGCPEGAYCASGVDMRLLPSYIRYSSSQG